MMQMRDNCGDEMNIWSIIHLSLLVHYAGVVCI